MSNELQTEPWILFGAKVALPNPAGAGMQEGYFYFAKDTKQLYVIDLVGGVRTWVRAAAAAAPTGVIHISIPATAVLSLTANLQVPLLALLTLRVAGGPAPGDRVLSDLTVSAPGATGPGIASIDATGDVLTFEAAYTDFFIQYIRRG